MTEISFTKTRVVMPRTVAAELSATAVRYRRLAEHLRDQLRDEHELLQMALHELARERNVKEPQLFARRWLRAHRSPDPDGVPRLTKEVRL